VTTGSTNWASELHHGWGPGVRIAFISDVHADVHALADALAQIERLGCDAVVCAGDLLDWGLFPAETIALLRQHRIPSIRGNHDRWAVGRGRADDPNADRPAALHDASGWDLSEDAMAFLAALPPAWSATLDGVRIAVHHASPGSDVTGIYPDSATETELRGWLDEADADVLVVGHTHIAFCMEVSGRGVVVNPGALLRHPAHPMDSAWLLDPSTGQFQRAPAPGGGTFGVLELPSGAFRVLNAADGAEVQVTRKRLGARPELDGGTKIEGR
jgi:putative phosphoesterase